MQILRLEIYVSEFNKTINFYRKTLGLSILSETEEKVSFQVGNSILTFVREEKNHNYYHFAFNIPPNLFRRAKNWMKQRTSLLKEDLADEIDFSHSKAKAFYVEDPAGNIVEFITRNETTESSSDEYFEPKHILEISEIGISTDNIKQYENMLLSMKIPLRHNEKIYYENYLNFFGEYSDGAFIIIGPLGRKWIFSEKVGKHCPVIIETDRGIIKNFS
ncbi:VOC family protein [Sutcliffiella rhizosphaerae]|uniref:VOC domain-containing protein n=1 Tax=Sutcliffiella rhizosphaerae TaxID=2880967 RepID=A0ABN8AG14_9BACI|nr:VOC family protein [Sutcliffiella rhizosphaerae]CAG9622677.1 hypothetical protein BACCIP111883_03468 [Sutcliffiella rhizosphaerae]